MVDRPLLTSLRIVNFKAFADETLLLRPLTLLTGLNGMGKSTVLQTLLLLRQSHLQGVLDAEDAGLLLNGEFMQLGFLSDAKSDQAGIDDDIIFELMFTDGGLVRWEFNVETSATNIDIGQIDRVPLLNHEDSTSNTYKLSSPFSNDFHYLQAERVGPRVTFAMSDNAIRRNQLGSQGEYAFHFLARNARMPILPALKHPSTLQMDEEREPESLLTQVNAWLQEFSPGVSVVIETYPEISAVRVSYQVDQGRSVSRLRRSVNYGFGVTYALSMLIAILSAKSGTLILLENPEAHLHPHGQVEMGELMSRAASAGVQLLVETHSDHILNGIRIAIHGDEEHHVHLDARDAIFHFFQRTSEGEMQIVSPTVDADGRFESQTPIHFFDEYRRSMRKLL